MTTTRLFSFFARRSHALAAAVFGALAFAAPAAAETADLPMVGVPKNWGIGFQPSASPVKHEMVWFHNDLLMPVITVTTIFVMMLLLYVMIRFNAKANPKPSKTTHNTLLEFVWTLVPVIILVIIVVPSLKLLYLADKTADAEMTLNIKGYQWYWGYEYPDHGDIEFSSYMIPEKDLQEGQVRLLSTDNPVVLPVDTNIRLLITANDVLHSWAMPALGVKMDAVPGRMNETWTRIEKEGVYFGQCSEICGTNHAFMPIEIHAVSKEAFAKWVEKQGGKMPEKTAEAAVTDAAPTAEN
ncbi:MAG: cytochrome c oxidase subunit II [Alphaproteobacteria bacterium]|nr:cytochrome c oxidase subunit II [Alphaproteobacteria bacterium]